MTPMTITVAECCVYKASRASEGAEAYHGFDPVPASTLSPPLPGPHPRFERVSRQRRVLVLSEHSSP
jgi:hypothetical protein